MRSVVLPARFNKIIERKKFLIAANTESNQIVMIDKSTLKVKKEVTVGLEKIIDIAAHPTLPLTYVSGRKRGDLPQFRFLIFNETTGKTKEFGGLVGSYLTVDPTGKRLYAAYHDYYQNGNRLNYLGRQFHLTPTYGDIDWLLTYAIGETGVPEIAIIKESVGSIGIGVRLTGDNKRVAYLSSQGIAGGNIGLWNAKNFEEDPQILRVKDVGNCIKLAVHPRLPLAVSHTESSLSFFDTESGKRLKGKCVGDESFLRKTAVQSVSFTHNGLGLLVHGTVDGVSYISRFDVQLDREELKIAATPTPAPPVLKGTKGIANRFENKEINLAELTSLRGGIGKEMRNQEIAKSSRPSIVLIQSAEAQGTGFVAGKNGYVITCAHCIEDLEDIAVTFEETRGKQVRKAAKLIAIDADRDIAILQVTAMTDVEPLLIAAGNLTETGEDVSVIGHPALGDVALTYTMTKGIVSSADRKFDGVAHLQTSATINPGCSGGPMFNQKGQVIGMVVAKARKNEGTGFAVSADELAKFLFENSKTAEDTLGLERSWYDSRGKGPLNAALISHDGDKVKLKRIKDERVFDIPLEKLSEPDQRFLSILKVHLK